MRLEILAFLAAIPVHAAEGPVTKGADYSHCRQMGNPYGYFMGALNEKGDFDLDPKAPGVSKITNSDDGNHESVVVKNPWVKGTFNSTYLLTKKDGRTESVEVEYNSKRSLGEVLRGVLKEKDPIVASVTRYAFKDENCYVSQTTYKRKSGMELVTYDHDACVRVLEAVKKIGAKKVQECGPVAYAIQTAVNAAEAKINGPNKKLALGSFMGSVEEPNSKFSNLMGSFAAASSCSMMRKMYGLPVDADSDVVPGGGLVGGITGMMGGEAPEDAPKGNSAPVQ